MLQNESTSPRTTRRRRLKEARSDARAPSQLRVGKSSELSSTLGLLWRYSLAQHRNRPLSASESGYWRGRKAYRLLRSGRPSRGGRGSGLVTPTCATLQPAVDGTELRTVLLAREFGFGEDNRPVRIDVVGPLRTVSGRSLRGLRIRDVDETNVGPRLVFGEFIALRDIDGDNHVDACLGAQALNLDFKPRGCRRQRLRQPSEHDHPCGHGGHSTLAGRASRPLA